ncbi:MAG: HDIG domain-containing metalloprotein, partial [Chloroflexota bacterium]
MLLITVITAAYLAQHAAHVLVDLARLPLLAFLLLLFIIAAKLMIPGQGPIPYLYPLAALTMMVVILIDTQLAFILTTILAFLGGYVALSDSMAIVIFLILSGWTGILALGKEQRVNNLLWAGISVGIVNAGIILIFNLSSNPVDIPNLGVLLLAGLLNGIFAAGLALLGLFAIGSLFGLTTSLQLIDLGRPTHPLLRQLLLKAPGTYHHSLMVSNLGEQAAERIGANSLLVRVMAYYHDVGKMQRPYFFIENQPEGINVHEKLDPQISAQIIISHVKDGLNLAHKYRLPPALKDGIAQHHGTSLVKYFYYQAVEAAAQDQRVVDEADFHYPGPRPQTKENGILMLADVSESTVRALKPGLAEEIDEIVQKVIADKLNSGELDECALTISDLHKIRTAFVDILQGVHHPRIKYPEQIKAEARPAAAAQPAAPEPAEEPAAPVSSPRPPLINPPAHPARLVRRE